MTLWKAEPDPHNKGQWRIINISTGKTVVYGLSQGHAEEFAQRRNFQEKKRNKEKQ